VRRTSFAIALQVLLAASACTGGPTPTPNDTAPPAKPVEAPKKLTLKHSPAKPVAGTDVEVTAEGLPAGKKVDVVWGTVNGGWVIEDHFRFRGKKFAAATKVLSQAEVDSSGRVSTRFKIPDDYGGVHEVMLMSGGTTLAQGGVEVSPTFEMSPSSGPVGTPVELKVTGLGWRTLDSTWVVNWDNQEIGWVSAADTRGAAVARFRATGPVGEHHVKVYTGYMGQGYLNYEQAPNAYLPRPDFVFRVTPGSAVTSNAYAEPYQRVPPEDDDREGASMTISPSQGPILTRTTIEATGLPPNSNASIVWSTQAGSRVTESGFAAKETELAKVTADGSGRIKIPVTVPDDLGGRHSLSLRSGEKTLAQTLFVIETSIVSITPASGPAGTRVSIHLKGVGWTDFDNIYVATYDNAYMGYACGFNSQGDVVVNFTAAGTPGVHLIDFYPGIYQGPPEGQQLYRLPQLTYADDHPGNKIPALRFAFEVTK
jgi:hypothetical protein